MAVQNAAGDDRLRLGALLKKSYAILLGNLSTFFIIMLGATSPLYGLYFWLGYDLGFASSDDATDTIVNIFLVGSTAGTLASMLVAVATGFIVYGAMREMQGQPASLGDILGRGFAVLVPVVLVALSCAVAVSLGFVLFLIPGLVLSVMFWVAIPAVVIERRGVSQSLQRSIELTKGYRWPIFGLLLLYIAVLVGFSYLSASFLDFETSYLRSLFVEWGSSAFLDAFFGVVSAVTYFELKRLKEGAYVEELADVFS